MSAARKYGPPASLGLAVAAFVFAALGRRTPVEPDRLLKFEAEASSYAQDVRALARKLDQMGSGIARLEEDVGALERSLRDAPEKGRESYMKAFRGVFRDILPRACDEALKSYRAVMTSERREYYRLIGQGRRALELDEKKAKEFAGVLLQERRERKKAERAFSRDKKKLDARLGEIKRGVEEKLRELLAAEEYERYESWRKTQVGN